MTTFYFFSNKLNVVLQAAFTTQWLTVTNYMHSMQTLRQQWVSQCPTIHWALASVHDFEMLMTSVAVIRLQQWNNLYQLPCDRRLVINNLGNVRKHIYLEHRNHSAQYTCCQTGKHTDSNKKHLKNVGPIRHCEPFYTAIHQVSLLLHAICASMSTTTTTTTTCDRGDRYGPIEWAQ